MNTNIWLIVGIVILVIVLFNFRKSNFTIQPFEGVTDQVAAAVSLKSQLTAILAEMTSALTTAKNENKTIDERIAISNTYNDQLHQLNKSFSEWILRHAA